MPKPVRTVHFVVSTHWDREWYESFQGFRFRLVSMFDEVLDTLERDPGFVCFQTDGQSIVLEDYLEIRPEREDLVERYAREGRLEIGPWYVLPDEFLVSGESLIRNIREGIQVSSRFGTPSRSGFVCDIFGHNSQLPQVLRGFGIGNAFLWRGLNEDQTSANFRWRSPDGSEVLTHRFGPRWGYCDYDFRARRGNQIDARVGLEELVEGLVEEVRLQAGRTPNRSLLVFDGGDHMEIEPLTPKVIEEANRRLEPEGFHIEFSTLSRYAAAMAGESEDIESSFTGELREPSTGVDDQWLIPGVLSSRIHLKQLNRRCEDLLCLCAEPLAALARINGLEGMESYLRTAWRHLLQNHPHDSICGCSIDQVHKDMIYRYDQCLEIGELVVRESLKRLARSIPGEVSGKRFPVLVANPLTFPVSDPVDLTLEIPGDCPTFQEFFGFERKPGFRIRDGAGNEIPYQLVHQSLDRVRFLHKRRKFPHGLRRHLVDVTVQLELPSLGAKTLWIETVEGPVRSPGKGMKTGHNSMSNDFMSVEVFENGTISLQDRVSGAFYTGLLTLEDCADIGDGWYHGVAANDEVFTSQAARAAISLVHHGPQKTTFRIEVPFEIPEHFDFTNMERSAKRGVLRVVHWVTLRRGVRRLEVRTGVENAIRDHRLRVLFPTFLDTETYWTDSAFDAIERPIALREDNHLYRELEVETKPQYTWTALSGEQAFNESEGEMGLAVVSRGLPESAVLDTDDREIALTLLRSFRKAVFTDGNEGGQIQGSHQFDYWIVPFDGAPDPVMLGREAQRLAAGIRTAQPHPLDDELEKKDLAEVCSMLNVEGDVLVTSIRAGEGNALLVRLYNPGCKETETRIKLAGGVVRAEVCCLLDERIEDVHPQDGEVVLRIGARKIVTLSLK